ncbi:hypothetical protein PPSIR1_09735, partial [Plesiocystis pacifica SIR-1]
GAADRPAHVDDAHQRACTLDVLGSDALLVDLGRLAAFVLTAWLHDEADSSSGGPPSEVFTRLDTHLLPLLGGCGLMDTPIGPFPIFDAHAAMGQAPSFDPWVDSIFTTNDDGAGPLTALWHLKALITGDESKSLFGGSCWIPLHTMVGSALGALDPSGRLAGDTSIANLTALSSVANADGVWLGLDDSTAGEYALVLRLRQGAMDLPLDLLRFAQDPSGKWSRIAQVSATGIEQLVGKDFSELLRIDQGPWRFTLLDEALGTPPWAEPAAPEWFVTIELEVGHDGSSVLAVELGPEGSPLIELRLSSTGDPIELVAPGIDAIVAMLGVPVLTALAEVIDDVIDDDGNPTGAPSFPAIVRLLEAIRGADELSFDFGPLTLTIDDEPNSVIIEPHLRLTGLQPEEGEGAIHIGGVDASVEIEVSDSSAQIKSISLKFEDLRFGELGGEEAGGLIGSLMPDLREVEGLDLGLSWTGAGDVIPSGGAVIPIQRSIGPFELSTIEFEIDRDGLDVGIDGEFSLDGLIVAPYGFGFSVPFGSGGPEFRLDGLGVHFDAGGLRLSGMFANMGGDFLGAAVLSCFDLFELAAIGGYTEIPVSPDSSDTEPSLFVFAALDAPLGGAPWCFVTGVAAGFGYNRRLPTSGKVSDNAFLRVLKGEPLDTSSAEAMRASLERLGQQFAPEKGSFWVAAGVEFLSFGLIQGKLVVALGFGNHFSFNIIGSAALGLKPLAFFELDFRVTADTEHFELVAELSRNSYLLHPDLFGVHGGFGLAVWWAGEHAGDFVLTIGGYHPGFLAPSHYPVVDRIGVKAVVYGFIHFAIDAYFAITPRVMMAGASASLWAEFMGIEAGLDVYVDVLIEWDPFYIEGRMGVSVWFYFLGRHEIGVDLTIWTPPLGGRATIDLALVSFDIEFGSKRESPGMSLPAFFTRQLDVPAEGSNSWLTLPTFSSEDIAGLLRVDVPWGRAARAGEDDPKGQEGLPGSQPIPVGPEFGVTLRSKLPSGAAPGGVEDDPLAIPPGSNHQVATQGDVDFPLCKKSNYISTLALTMQGANSAFVRRRVIVGKFPQAQFGERVDNAQADDPARYAKAIKESEEPAVLSAVAGIALDFTPVMVPANGHFVTTREEPSTPSETYPLALGRSAVKPSGGRPSAGSPVGSGSRGSNIPTTPIGDLRGKLGGLRGKVGKSPLQARTPIARKPTITRKPASLRSARTLRTLGGAASKSAAVAGAALRLWQVELPRIARPARPSGGVSSRARRIEVPSSPARGPALAAVELRVLRPKGTRAGVAANASRTVTRLPRLESTVPIAKGALRRVVKGGGGSPRPSIDVPSGKAVFVDLAQGRAARGRIVVSGTQIVRAVFLGKFGEPVGSAWVDGRGVLAIPGRASAAVMVGEGRDAPVDPRTGQAREAVGVERSSLLFAADRDTLVGHGCVLDLSERLGADVQPLDLVPGPLALRSASTLHLELPALPKAGCLVVMVSARVAKPRPLIEQIGGQSEGATLDQPTLVGAGERVALVFPVRCRGPWSFEYEAGQDWALDGIAAVPRAAAGVVERLRSTASWDLIDDRWAPPAKTASTLRLELA